MSTAPVLILGGTGEARALASALVDAGVPVVSSLAGRVAHPRLPDGEVRIGGFGGAEGLRDWIASHGVRAVIDATHPFSDTISHNAAAACGVETSLLRLERPGWADRPGAETWHWTGSHEDASTLTASIGERPLITVGRQPLQAFVGPLASAHAVVRVVDAPTIELPTTWVVLESRGPYDVATERDVFTEHQVDVLVTKDSGGEHTWPKMEVAAELGVPVVVVRRTSVPHGVETVATVEEALAWIGR